MKAFDYKKKWLPAKRIHLEVENGQWINYKPLSSLTDDAPIEFVIPDHDEAYLDFFQTMLSISASIKKTHNMPINETDNAGAVNNWLHSIFSQVDIYLNQNLVSPANNTYSYRVFIETLLNYGQNDKKQHLSSALWYTDQQAKWIISM